ALTASEDFPDADLSEETFRDRLLAEAENGRELTAAWSRALTAWDYDEQAAWTQEALRTQARRAAAYDRLQFGDDLRKALTAAVPIAELPGPVVIATEHTPWYTPERAAARS
ncbi:endonuclease, partial [Streptomyces sp. SID11233]|nr:endonuclease [Streptomyces sp. SID11233]